MSEKENQTTHLHFYRKPKYMEMKKKQKKCYTTEIRVQRRNAGVICDFKFFNFIVSIIHRSQFIWKILEVSFLPWIGQSSGRIEELSGW
jgi:hypothetical protein